ncbi:MAG: type VI secretion system tip protein VgrG [Desulfuromonadales bacterium]|nr:type VI secretion system tip protein VgrG [Desulfuromonadales bacterium]
MAYIQENRLIAIDTPLGKDVLLLAEFHGSEGISRLFSFELNLVSENHNISFADIVGKNVTLSIILADASVRYLNGVISRFAQGRGGGDLGGDPRFSRYRATMVPWLWLLTRTADSRIFQKLSVPDIIEKVFKEQGFNDFKMKLQSGYAERDYCVQYRETDFAFVTRLLEEEGIQYFFEHEKGKHTLILADSPQENKPCPHQSTARYQLSGEGRMEEDVITGLDRMQEIRPAKYTLNDFNFEIPNTDLKANVPSSHKLGPGEREIYDYPGMYAKKNEGDRLARIRMEEEEAQITTIIGSSSCRAFTSGYRFSLTSFFRSDMNNKEYVLATIEHGAEQGWEDKSDLTYSNRFTCIPFDIPFRPPRLTPKPVVHGSQTAIVVGPKGDEIYTDEHGRVKVQFHWDREGKKDENSSCWIRVAQVWAGASWGAMYIPRIGQEVIVDFLEGDPDRPIITGRVYHGMNKPPYPLPAEKTKSTIKSNSSQGGEGFNEFRFEDKKGEEQIFVHAERDMDQRVKNDIREWVGRDRSLIVKRDNFETIEFDRHLNVTRDEMTVIGRDRHLKVAGKEATEVAGSRSITVNGDMIEVIRKSGSVEAGGDYYIKGMNVVIEGMTGLTIKVGGSFVTLNSGGVFISGPLVNINSGGAALSGVAGKVVAPIAALLAAVAADALPGKGDKGEQRHKDDDEKNKDKKSWIEIELVDEDGKPVPGEVYKVTLPDGETVATGTLDEKGIARIEGIDPGNCKITFPNLDKDAWAKA